MREQQLVIYMVCFDILDVPSKSEWKCKDGVISVMCKLTCIVLCCGCSNLFILHVHHMQLKLGQRQRNTVARTLKNAYECHKHDIPYDNTWKSAVRCVPFIQIGSVESGLITDGMERSMGLSFCTAMVNEYRKT